MPIIPSSINAVCSSGDGKTIFFFIQDYIVQYNTAKKRVIDKPKLIGEVIKNYPKTMGSPNHAHTQRAFLNPVMFYVNKDQYWVEVPNSLQLNSNTPWDPTVFDDYSKFVPRIQSVCEFKSRKLEINLDGRSFNLYDYSNSIDNVNKVFNVQFPAILPKITSALYYPHKDDNDTSSKGSVILFSDDLCYDFGTSFRDFNMTYKNYVYDIPKAEKIVHKFQGVPLHHVIDDQSRQIGVDSAQSYYKEIKNEIPELHKQTALVAKYFNDNNLKAVPNDPLEKLIKDIYGLKALYEWAIRKKYGVLWIGLTVEVGYFFKANAIEGLAFQIDNSKVTAFTSVSLGAGYNIGVEGGIVVGYHKGSLEEFNGVEWDVDFGLEIEVGGQLSFEFSGNPIQGVHFEGFSLGVGVGEEVTIGGGVLYRFTY
ncbi:hypothetical protein [Psychroserpens sp. MEBiC05023]